jgi:hypothetical protein
LYCWMGEPRDEAEESDEVGPACKLLAVRDALGG